MGSSCLWNGTLSPDEFYTAATALAKRWKEIDSTLPEWIWIPCQRMGVPSSNVGGDSSHVVVSVLSLTVDAFVL